MKRMVYIVIAFTGLVVAAVLMAGCAPGKKTADAEVTGISIYQNHMNFGSCYSFYLREEDGKVLFDAEVRFDKEPYCIILESCEVDNSYIESLRTLDKNQGITKYVSAYKSKPSLFSVSDETVNRTTVYLSDGTEKTADTKYEHIEIIYDFFFELAQEYLNQSVYKE